MLAFGVFILTSAVLLAVWLVAPQWTGLCVFLLVAAAITVPLWDSGLIHRAWKFIKE